MAKETLVVYVGELKHPPSHFEAGATVHSTFNACVRGQLLTRTKGFKLNPSLIEEYKFDFESKAYILNLREGLTFHNGRKATAADLEFSLVRGFFSPRSNFFKARFGNIKGVKNIKPGTKYESGLVTGIKILDERTLSVELDEPNPSFFQNLNSPYYSLIPIEALKDDYLSWKDTPVGVGDYRVEKEENGLTLLTLAQPSPKKPQNIELHWGAKEPSNTDLSLRPIDGYKNIQSDYPVAVRLIEFSNQNELSKYKEFRLAVGLLLNRKDLKNEELGVEPIAQVLPKHFWGRVESQVDQNLEEAKKLLSKIPESVRTKKYQAIVFAGKSLSALQKFYIKKMEEDFKTVGLNISIAPNSEKFVSKQTAMEAPFRMAGKIVDYVDPLIMFGSYRKAGHDSYLMAQGEDLDKFQKLYEDAANVESLEERIETVKELNHFTRKNGVVVSLAEEKTVYFINPNSIESLGQQLEPMTLFLANIKKK